LSTPTDGGAAGGTPAPGAPGSTPQFDQERIARLIQRLGGPDAAIAEVIDENARYRARHRDDAEQIRKLTEQVQSLAGKVPQDGAVVLSGDAAQQYQALAALNLTADAVKAALAERDQYKQAALEHAAQEVIAKAAHAHGLDAKKLAKALKGFGLAVKVEDVTVERDGEKKLEPRAVVRAAADEQAQWAPLADNELLADFLPAMRAGEDTSHGSTSNSTGTTGSIRHQPAVIPFPDQSSGGKAPKADVVGQALSARYTGVLPSQRNKAQ
jgi:hypothetical protein